MAIIMVVDDDATTRVLLRRGFERAAFTVIEANDGLDACDLAVSARPDIIPKSPEALPCLFFREKKSQDDPGSGLPLLSFVLARHDC
jgi:hypothetical protein